MEIDIYDFDKTIVSMDSGSKFWIYCLLHYPWTLIMVPFQVVLAILMLCKAITFAQFKKYFFCFVTMINLDKAVKKFWDKYEKRVFPWFKEEKRERYTVVISASPDFLLDEIAQRLGFDKLICTRHEKKSGKIIGNNCKGNEKVIRLNDELKDYKAVNVYSDSLNHDKYIFSLGENCYHVVKGERVKFNYKDKFND